MNNVTPDSISEEVMSELLPIWKEKEVYSQKLSKYAGAVAVVDWISYFVELKLKKETIAASKKKLPDLERKIKAQFGIIAETNSRIQQIDEQIKKIQDSIGTIQLTEDDVEEEQADEFPV